MAWSEYPAERRKDYGRANRGREFEALINFANLRYQSRGLAVVYKVPTEFLPIRNAKGQVVSCKVEKKSCADFIGHYLGIPIAVEAKSTKEKSILFSQVEDHQADFLDDWIAGKGPQLAFVLARFQSDRIFAVPWPFWKAGRDAWLRHRRTGEKAAVVTVERYGWSWKTPGGASVKPETLLPDWEIIPGGQYALPYLQIIDKIAGGNMQHENTGPGNRDI